MKSILEAIKRRKKPIVVSSPTEEKIIKVGGRFIKEKDWSPDVLEEIKKDYFLPPAAQGSFCRTDLIGTCPEGHATIVRVGLLTQDSIVNDKILSNIQHSKIKINCTTCAKPSILSGKTIIWKGSLKAWDGTT